MGPEIGMGVLAVRACRKQDEIAEGRFRESCVHHTQEGYGMGREGRNGRLEGCVQQRGALSGEVPLIASPGYGRGFM